MNRIVKVLLAAVLLIVMALGGFVGGAVFERLQGPLVSSLGPKSSDTVGLVGDVRELINNEALQVPSETSMTIGAIGGLLSSLDDTYAAYFDPKAFQEFTLDSKGEFFGVGMSLGLHEGTPTVVAVFDGTPAFKAGIKAGDAIVSIDGKRDPKWTLDDYVSRIRGPIGTKVTLVLSREGAAGPLTFTVTRDRITIPNVMSEMIGKDVGHIRLMSFNERSAEDVRSALKELEGKGAKGFILDLRGNPGGLLRSAVQVSSLFVESGVIVRVDERGKPEQQEFAVGDLATTKPLVLLVDGNSASASEIVAGALQDYARATIVGETTFGKGSVQTIRDLSNGGAVKFTTAHYLTPKKRVINKKGVTPDVISPMDPKLQADKKTDTQLTKAAEVLRGKF
ncbi:MAG TPA: S41 family peptidase [Coriobacteriia bacterium]